jgi:hypothetical protein
MCLQQLHHDSRFDVTRAACLMHILAAVYQHAATARRSLLTKHNTVSFCRKAVTAI